MTPDEDETVNDGKVVSINIKAFVPPYLWPKCHSQFVIKNETVWCNSCENVALQSHIKNNPL